MQCKLHDYIVLIHHQGQHTMKQATTVTVAQLIQTGDIHD